MTSLLHFICVNKMEVQLFIGVVVRLEDTLVGKHKASKYHMNKDGIVQQGQAVLWNHSVQCVSLLVELEQKHLVYEKSYSEKHECDNIEHRHAG